ncbi:MAG: ABC-type transport auxiliary lipoprotein family protein [Hyphomonadaceae bacterium]|uniref:ABC-type transport auxiliary lipoprotein family protein n=1 Tax=Aquidulcibacter sp. TaxID=2052990 RepID=UPI0022C75498|nr:ABC-type transport auxiliary lipoprotein family protein [Aquidulcibacter sp.]MCE2891861.1 ABC-type transport auxiliary lipoprotein family protein [Hyphomonadaceae bacterium]MCZ8209900.1 ABC-type transport auxiliary lipoprotein family protein [Aquidulcibacter sp.]
MKLTRRLGLLLAIATMTVPVAGCITLLPKPGKPPAVVAMRADPTVPKQAQKGPFTIGIGVPTMPAILLGNQIAVLRKDRTFAYVDGLRFSASAPLSIQNVVLETFDLAGSTRAAVRAVTIARPDYELHFDVSDFQVTEPQGRTKGMARIEATARLIEVYSGKPLASQVITGEAIAARGDVTQPARALEQATRSFAIKAMKWAVEEANADYASKAASATK